MHTTYAIKKPSTYIVHLFQIVPHFELHIFETLDLLLQRSLPIRKLVLEGILRVEQVALDDRLVLAMRLEQTHLAHKGVTRHAIRNRLTVLLVHVARDHWQLPLLANVRDAIWAQNDAIWT